MIKTGLTHTSELIVTEMVTAINVGSGDLPVFATPAMMALMENAAMLTVSNELPERLTTVGGHISVSHLRPTKIGDKVSATGVITQVEGKKIEFKVTAQCNGQIIGEGTYIRYIVDRKKFLERI